MAVVVLPKLGDDRSVDVEIIGLTEIVKNKDETEAEQLPALPAAEHWAS